MRSGGLVSLGRGSLGLRLGLAALLAAAIAFLIGVAAPGVVQANSVGAFATASKIDQVRVRCAHTGPQKGLVRVDAEVRHADVRNQKRFRDHHLIVRAKVKLRKDNGSRLATMRGRGKLRTAVKGKATAHRYHDYLGTEASKRVLRYARGNSRCAEKPGTSQSLAVDTRISQRLKGAGGSGAQASGASSPRTQSVGDTRTRNVLGADPPLFRAPIETPGGGKGPNDVAIGHFTQQPILDVVMPNSISDNTSILLGTGTGEFMPARGSPFAVGKEPQSVAVGDLNGDSEDDLAVANEDSDNVSVLLGTGTGTFNPGPGSPVAVGDAPHSVAVGRFTSLAKSDLAVANLGSNNVSVLLGTGTGGFAQGPGSPYAVGVEPVSLAVGNFLSLPISDLAVANISSANVSVLLGTDAGTFTPAPASPFAVGEDLTSVAVGDLNGDQADDLAVGSVGASKGAGNVSVLLATGTGSFSPAPGSPIAGGNPTSLAIGDLNGDGKNDLATTNLGNFVSVLLGTGSGTFNPAPGSPFAAGALPLSVAVGDLNGDGKDDLAVGDAISNKVSVLLNNG